MSNNSNEADEPLIWGVHGYAHFALNKDNIEKNMKINFFKKIIILLMISFGLASCVNKLPKPSLKNPGMLVIANDTSNSTGKSGFGYWYTLSYSPINGPKIEIWPESNDLLIYKNFPPGKYRLNYVTMIPLPGSQMNPLSGRKTIQVPNAMSSYYCFEIKPNHITLLNARFTVSIENADNPNFYSQSCEFQKIKHSDRKKI